MRKKKQAESEGLSSPPLGALRQSIVTHPKPVRCVEPLHDCASHDSVRQMIMDDNNNTTTPTHDILPPSASTSAALDRARIQTNQHSQMNRLSYCRKAYLKFTGGMCCCSGGLPSDEGGFCYCIVSSTTVCLVTPTAHVLSRYLLLSSVSVYWRIISVHRVLPYCLPHVCVALHE